MDSKGYFENMDYQLFILLAEVLKFCPDIQYMYGHYNDDVDKLSFFGSKSRHSICELNEEFTVSVYRKDGEKPVKIKDLYLFDYKKYLSTKEFRFNTYKTRHIYWELESENISYNDILEIIKKTYIDFPIDENNLKDLYLKERYFKKLKISLQSLDKKESYEPINSCELKSLYNLKDLTLEEIKLSVSKLKYCIDIGTFKEIAYGKIPLNVFEELLNKYRTSKEILEDEGCFKLIEDYYKCEPIKRIYYWSDKLFMEVI